MARSRNIKPGFFTNEDLVELDFATRLLFAGLWTIADKEGRLEDRPKKIKIDVFPADSVDVDTMLQSLHDRGFIVRYTLPTGKFIQIDTWAKHQNPHHTEKASVIPDKHGELTVKAPLKPVDSRKLDGGNLADSLLLIPDSLITDSIKIKQRPKAAPSVFVLPEWVNREHWDAWHQCTKRRKANDAQKRLTLEKLADWRDAGLDHAGALQNAAIGGNQGIFLPSTPQARASPAESNYTRQQREKWETVTGRNRPQTSNDVLEISI